MLQSGQNIVFKDLVSFLAFELDQSAEVVRHALWSDSTRIPALLEKMNQSDLFQWSPTVSEPIFYGSPTRGAALVEANVQLQPGYVTRLVERQVRSADNPIGPISMGLTSGLLFHYRERITQKMGVLLADVRKNAQGGVGGIHRLLAASPELSCVQQIFEEIVTSLLSNPHMLQTMILAFSDQEAGSGFKKGINAALVSMAVLSQCSRPRPTEEKKKQLIEIGMAAVLQDISLLAEEGASPEDHPELSAQIALQRGATDGVASLIRLHHTLKTKEGLPVLVAPEALSEQARVLVATNAYLGMVEQNLCGGTVELIKRLMHLASERYLDSEAVKIISRMCLPSIKASIIEGATEILRECVQEKKSALPWPVVGDRIPAVLMCNDPFCTYRASQTISLSKSLPFIVDERLIAMIPSGDYRVCSLLSDKLKSLFISVQAQISQQH